jgi:hypothetical protein
MALIRTLGVLAVLLLLVLTVLMSLVWLVLAVGACLGWVGTRLLRLRARVGRDA